MAKTLGEYENHRLEVTIDMRHEFREPNHKEHVRRLNDIKESIERHCDDVGDVYVLFDAAYKCEHCGSVWTEDENDYNGGCCQKDEDGKP